jgi:hypothetical protein
MKPHLDKVQLAGFIDLIVVLIQVMKSASTHDVIGDRKALKLCQLQLYTCYIKPINHRMVIIVFKYFKFTLRTWNRVQEGDIVNFSLT